MTPAALPVWPEWGRVILTLLTGAGCVWLGAAAAAQSAVTGRLAAAGAVALGAAAAATHYPPGRDLTGWAAHHAGGEGVVACLALLLLLGVALQSRANRGLIWGGGGVAFLVISGLLSGPLYWHYTGAALRANLPDRRGRLKQTTGVTCGPAAGVMLLHRFGLNVSEGLLAEAAGTDFLSGTDEFSLAAGMQRLSGKRNLRAMVRRLTYAQALEIARPFVAFVYRPGIGGHAILVERISEVGVETVDPLGGSPALLTRADLEAEWKGVAIWLEEPA